MVFYLSLFNSGIVSLTYPFTPHEADSMLGTGDETITMHFGGLQGALVLYVSTQKEFSERQHDKK